MQTIKNSLLNHIMHPESVAVIGASNNMLNMGTTLLNNLLSFGFKGPVYPVHPKSAEVLGLKAYRNVLEIPAIPDLALVVVPTRIVAQVMRECGEKGIRRAIIVSGGFRESGEEGQRLEEELLRVTKQFGIRFIGPNCIGVVNPAHRFNTTFFHYDASMKGFIGMVSQSGSFITQMFSHLNKFGLGFSQGFSVGNQADIDMADCVEYLAACDRTKVIGLYIEGLAQPKKFSRIAREVSKHKPLVALYVGGTEAGSRAGSSHTGALSGADRIYEGFFRQCGIIRARTIEELFDFCWTLGTQPLMRDNRVAVFTNSGGPGACAADAANRVGLRVPILSAKTQEKIREAVPHTGSLNNPIDLTYTRNYEDMYDLIPRTLLEDQGFDGILMYFLPASDYFKRLLNKTKSPFFDTIEDFEKYMLDLFIRFTKLVKSYKKPFLGSSFLLRSERLIREVEDLGIPILPSPERSANAMGALYRYSLMRKLMVEES